MVDIFEDVTQQAGITLNTEKGSFSVNWLDFDGDGLPDLFATPHAIGSNNYPKLYINKGDGTFINKSSQVFPANLSRDTHGTSWADFDNDGDPDLFLTAGAQSGTGAGPKYFFVNEDGTLLNKAVTLGLDFPSGRGRHGLWLDWNKDGLLDLLQVNDARTDGLGVTTLFEQTADGHFINADITAGVDVSAAAISAQTADLFGDGLADVIVFSDVNTGSGILKVYQTPPLGSEAPILKDITNKLPNINNIRDAAIADFNGDLIPDIFLARAKNYIYRSNILQSDPSLALARLSQTNIVNQNEIGVSFKTTDNTVTFNLADTAKIPNTSIFIGSGGYNPSSTKFSLLVTNPNVQGIIPIADRTKNGLYIGYDSVSQTWQARLFIGNNSTSTPATQIIDLIIDTNTSLTDLTPLNFSLPNIDQIESIAPVLLTSNPQTGKYVNTTQAAGLSTPISSQSVVYGDFDNDMDLDLYLTSVSLLGVRQSIYYDNQGDGTFVRDSNVAGALIKITGPRFEDFNSGLNISTGDYNRDGFLDMFVGSATIDATGVKYQGSPYHLFKNKGNTNHWLEINLEGKQSNRDAIGTKVYVVAGGVTQLREQNGGIHRMGQNEDILHFGLGNNTNVDSIIIKWASGIEQEFNDIEADQLIKYVEPYIDPNEANQPTPNDDNLLGTFVDDTLNGLAGNDTINGLAGDDTLLGSEDNDSLIGDIGNDTLDGGLGNDTLDGGKGNDSYVVDNIDDFVNETATQSTEIDIVQASINYTLGLNVENLLLTGDAGINGIGNNLNNLITGNTNDNNISGQAGKDTLDGNIGSDTLDGGTGNDFYVVDNINDLINETATDTTEIDRVEASINYTLSLNIENLSLIGNDPISATGNNLNNSLDGNDANNNLSGLDGKDILDGMAGIDTLNGGLGNDTYFIDLVGDLIIETNTITTEIDTVNSLVNYTLVSNLENIYLIGDDPIKATGNNLNNYIKGNNNNNVLSGLSGNDTIDGMAGIDNLNGGLGNDIYFINSWESTVNETSTITTEIDTVNSSVNYTLSNNCENLIIIGTNAINGTGNSLNNSINGNDANNNLSGLDGNDTIDGKGGIDTLFGGNGNDIYFIDNSSDLITETNTVATEIDTVNSSVNYILKNNFEKLILIGINATNGTGNSLNNSLDGNDANNNLSGLDGEDTIDGKGGIDTLFGGNGNDIYFIDNSSDLIIETSTISTEIETVNSSVNYTLRNNCENLILTGTTATLATGNSLNNFIAGNNANNFLYGLTGNDTLDGVAGNDFMNGSFGNDTYFVDKAGDNVYETSTIVTEIDTVNSSINYTLSNNCENLILIGTTAINGKGNSLNNSIIGNEANNNLSGLDGNDTLNGSLGFNTLEGGLGNDLYIVASSLDVINETSSLITEIDTVESGVSYTLSTNLENLLLTDSINLNGTGNSLDNHLIGNSAENILSGEIGNDTLEGGLGNDTLIGYSVANEIDLLIGGTNNDVFILGNSNSIFYNGDGNNGYAIISDLATDDIIQLKSQSSDYTLISDQNFVGTADLDTAIATTLGDIIGVVQDNTSLLTSMSNSIFSYV